MTGPALLGRVLPSRTRPAGTATGDATVAVTAAAVLCAVLATAVLRRVDPAVTSGPAAAAPAAGLGALLGLAVIGAAGLSLVRRHDGRSGPADRVTLARGVLTAGCATLAVPVATGLFPPRSWTLVLLLVPALALDAVDGRVARRTGTSSAAGGKLDGEMDAALLLVLSLAAAPSTGAWVLGIGLMRYAFFAVGLVRPAWRGPLGFSQFRRVVAALQGVMLAVALAPAVPVPLGQACVALALVLLTVSFGLDVVTLETEGRRSRRAGQGHGVDPRAGLRSKDVLLGHGRPGRRRGSRRDRSRRGQARPAAP